MPTFEFTVTGLDELKKVLESAPAKLELACRKSLYQFAEETMAASKDIVPVAPDGGALMNTGKVLLPVMEGTTVMVELGYGDESVDYALYVHEALEGPHEINPNWSWAKKVAAGGQIDWTRPGSGPKYLERPYNERVDELPARVTDAIREAFKP